MNSAYPCFVLLYLGKDWKATEGGIGIDIIVAMCFLKPFFINLMSWCLKVFLCGAVKNLSSSHKCVLDVLKGIITHFLKYSYSALVQYCIL